MGEETEDEEFRAPGPSLGSLVAWFVIVAFAGTLGTMFAVSGWEYVRVALGAGGYVPTDATITEATVHQESQNHVPQVSFAYTYRGERYEADSRYTTRSFRDAKLARSELKRYKTGESLRVFVDPKHPERAVLTREVPWGRGGFRVGLALAFYTIIALAIYSFRRGRVRARAAARSAWLREQKQRERDASRKAWSQNVNV